jgi:small-conductance mechanosensitive channel
LISELDDVRRRLTAVEEETASLREWRQQAQHVTDLFGTLDKELADLRVAAGQQRNVLNAIGMTHAEHHTQFLRQADILGGLVLEVGGVRRTQAEHGQMLKEHKQMLSEQGRMLREVLDRLPA